MSVGDRCGVRSGVRPVDAVHVTAGPDEVRVPGPNQTNWRCQVKANQSLLAQTRSASGRAKLTPLGESGDAAILEGSWLEGVRPVLNRVWTEGWTDANFCNVCIRRKRSMAR